MARYKYIPISYNDYMNNYLRGIKTGELLVDLTEHDIYVTEEGIAVPIPTTKILRNKIIDYLENDSDGIEMRRKTIPGKVDNIFNIQKSIEERQLEVYNLIMEQKGVGIDFDRHNTFITTVNEINVNQLGQLTPIITNLDGDVYINRINQLVSEFNNYNNDASAYSSQITTVNTTLNSIWTEIVSLMNVVNAKLVKMNGYTGNIKLRRNSTRTVTAYDMTYSRRLYNWTNWTTINSQSQLLSASQGVRPKFISWFRGNAYQDVPVSKMGYDNSQGTGFWYKNFPNKVNLSTGNKYANKYSAWDLLESIPSSSYPSTPAGFNIGFYKSPTNNLIPDLYSKGMYASASAFTTRYEFSKPAVDKVKFGGGSDYWRQPFTMNGATTAYTDNTAMSHVSNMNDKYGMQRTPKSTKAGNNISGAVSSAVQLIPTIARQVPYVSSAGIRNNDGMIVRLGLQKRLNETELAYSSYTYNNSSGWRKT